MDKRESHRESSAIVTRTLMNSGMTTGLIDVVIEQIGVSMTPLT